MPFRFGMRKARRYEVSSKNSYIVCVHLLDMVLMDCVLTSESNGQECLDNIAIRIGLNEIQYFGLRYLTRKLQFRWVDLDKPLKKQLEKYAQSSLLYFGVMFCIGDILLIQDEMSRYQYYLHLKTEIVDSRLQCSSEQAIVLAAYSAQAEIGNYDSEQHELDYLNKLAERLPQNITTEEHVVRQLTRDVAAMHQQLFGVTPTDAKLQYIVEAQQLEGYGLEYYPVKDTAGKDLLLGTSFIGIFVKPLTGNQPTVYFKWSDILNFSHSRRQFGINTKLSDKPFFFLLEDTDYAKYVYKICCLQQKFYKSNSHLQATVSDDREVSEDSSGRCVNNVEQDRVNNLSDLQRDVMASACYETQDELNSGETPYSEYLKAVNESSQTVIINESSDHLPPTSLHHHLHPQMNDIYHHDNTPIVGMNASMYTIQTPSSSASSKQNLNLVSAVDGLSRLPSYRPPPDYKTIMCQKMDQIVQQAHQRGSTPGLLSSRFGPSDVMAYSQPDIHQLPLQYIHYYNQNYDHHHHQQPFLERHLYVNNDMSQHACNSYHPTKPVDRTSSLVVYPSGLRRQDLPIYRGPLEALDRSVHVGGGSGGEMLEYQPSRPVDRASSLVVYPSDITTRPNDCLGQYDNMPDIASHLQYRLPPPYPRQSTSTPDLALQMANVISHSSPDLASYGHRGRLVMQSRFDQSMDNLAFDARRLHLYELHSTPSREELDQADVQRQMNSYMDVNWSGGGGGGGGGETFQYPDLTKDVMSANVVAAARNNMIPVTSVDLSRLAMLQHFKQQNRINVEARSKNTLMEEMQQITDDEQRSVQDAFYGSVESNQLMKANQLEYSVDELQMPLKMAAMHQSNDLHAMHQSNDLHHQTKPNSSGSTSPTNSLFGGRSQTNSAESRISDGLSRGSLSSRKSERIQETTTTVSTPGRMINGGINQVLKTPRTEMVTRNAATIIGGGGIEIENGRERKGPKDEWRRTLEAKLEEGQVFAEFEQVPKKRVKFDCATACHESNRDRNRFKDVVLPYEDNRVRLKASKENPSGYINASHIKVKVGKEEFWYIATQGPLPKTLVDFWQMVWENDVKVIAMLTGLNDVDQRKCVQYWPDGMDVKHVVKIGDFTVAVRYINESALYVTRGLVVQHVPSKTERLVWHLQYTDWPDHGCPPNHHGFLEYLDEINAIKRQVLMDGTGGQRNSPIVVHCSAGVGRTGVLILTETMKTAVDRNVKIDLPTSLKLLRDQRMHMVQTVTQYSFVYQIIVLYLQSSRLI